jgi:hypothetical protein
MVFILLIVICLVAWALHLMQEALEHREFSLMLAGFLVSVAAAALVGVYFLVGHYVGYMSQMTQQARVTQQYYETAGLIPPGDFSVATDYSSAIPAELSFIKVDGLQP